MILDGEEKEQLDESVIAKCEFLFECMLFVGVFYRAVCQ
jgi:hypothetical protein